MDREPIVIVSGVRTPMGGFLGSLSPVSATELGTLVVRKAVGRSGLAPEDVDHVILGCVLPAGLKQNPARQAALEAGLPVETGCTTLNVDVRAASLRKEARGRVVVHRRWRSNRDRSGDSLA